MKLEGSCHCKAVRFSVQSHEPMPFMRCYCSICRKTAGTGGFAINLGADFETLQIDGKENLSIYRAKMDDGHASSGERNFCKLCGTALWLWDPNWPQLVHPHAGAIDTRLPEPPCTTHMMLGSKADWVSPCLQDGDARFDGYPLESLAQWHARNGPGL